MAEAENCKQIFINEYFKRCFYCKKVPERAKRCPLLERTFCKLCSKKEEFKLLNKKKIKKIYGISDSCLKIKFGTGWSCNNKVSYNFLIKKAVYNARELKKIEILQKLKGLLRDDCSILKIIQEINYTNMESFQGTFYRTIVPNYDQDLKKLYKSYTKIFDCIRSASFSKDNFKEIINLIYEEFPYFLSLLRSSILFIEILLKNHPITGLSHIFLNFLSVFFILLNILLTLFFFSHSFL